MASFDLFSDLPGLLQGGQASHRDTEPLPGRPGISQGGQASQRVLHNLTKKYFSINFA